MPAPQVEDSCAMLPCRLHELTLQNNSNNSLCFVQGISWVGMGNREQQYQCSWVPPTVDSRCSCQGVLDVVTQSAEDTEEPKADLSERREPAGRLRTQAALL